MSWKLPDERVSQLRGPSSYTVENGGFELPWRLANLLHALPRRPRVLDVGADHGLMALAALRCGIASEVLAIDRREGPLEGAAARSYLRSDDAYRFVLSDGLNGVKTAHDDLVVVAGMSGENAATILHDALLTPTFPLVWAFQVNDGHDVLRRTLFDAGFCALSEWFVAEPKRFFLNQIWTFRGSRQSALERDCALGPLSMSGHSPLMKVWIELERRRLARDLEGLKRARDYAPDDARARAIVRRDRLLAGQSLEIPAQTD